MPREGPARTTRRARRPTRCATGRGEGDGFGICEIDPSACPSDPRRIAKTRGLVTIGELAERARHQITRSRKTPVDASDVECERQQGHDTEAEDLVSGALAKGHVDAAFAIVKSAAGRLRVQMVGRLAMSSDPRVMAFLLDEATSAPVLGARMRAIDALLGRPEMRVRLAATAIDAAMRRQGPQDDRCDRDLVLDRWGRLLDADAVTALAPVATGFASYGPQAKLAVVHRVLQLVLVEQGPPGAPVRKAVRTADATSIIALALADTRPVVNHSMSFTVGPPTLVRPRVYSGRTVSCHAPSPSDVAAVFLAERLHVGYACDDSPADKAEGVKRILALRGKPSGW
jgi:hypothetical protein